MSIPKPIWAFALVLCAQTAMAQQVALNGVLGTKALLIVDGGAQRA